ncbi:zinc-dependent alcohol dehydrogenase family protein [uncultured Pantoea sp.]|uniref:zinc-dependent alcohol dehydrogenase family protein n=1 Tax=uncultured Pantoea sp. TaxID=218084 RepID=UPI00258D9286|nr:zinc-dependent alcohol dehydrogenase family protein [uncultured Pantoea sp.]
MKAVIYESFLSPPVLKTLPDPTPDAHGVVIRVKATGVCRSDWHGWVGHDPDIPLPHVPGHEFAGTIEAVGSAVTKWRPGDNVTVPFVAGCGLCHECHSGNQQVCDHQFQPGFTHWGSFAEYVAIQQADLNLIALPDTLNFTTAASLGCRFITAFRAVVDQGKTSAGQWLAVHGCGGVGLSAIMIANAFGANVVAVDISEEKLQLARDLGAVAVVNASHVHDVAEAVRDITQGGAHVSVDALGHTATCINSINALRKRGKHVQIGLMAGEHSAPPIPMARVIANELEIIGSHGMQAHRYDVMMNMIHAGKLRPEKLIGRTITLEQSIEALMNMDKFASPGVTVVTAF